MNKPPVRNDQLTEQLSALLSKKPKADNKKQKKTKELPYFNKDIDLQSWKADGEDHINICSSAETVLGKFLCHDTPHRFKHPVLGNFNTIRGFWFYIQSVNHNDRYRTLVGKALKLAHANTETVVLLNFRAVLMDACWQRLKQTEEICKIMKESTLPFDCYFIHNESKLRVRPVYHSWVTSATEEMRKALKEKREADFTYLMKDKTVDLYWSITPDYLKHNDTVDVNVPVEADGVDVEDQTVYEENQEEVVDPFNKV